MDEHNLKEKLPQKNCQKCGQKIGGKAYYVVEVDCIFDGDTISTCDTIVICSNCNAQLKSWLNI